MAQTASSIKRTTVKTNIVSLDKPSHMCVLASTNNAITPGEMISATTTPAVI